MQQLTVRIEDVETLLDEVSSGAYDKAVEKVAKEAMLATRRDDIRLQKILKVDSGSETQGFQKRKGLCNKKTGWSDKKIETAMEKVVIRITNQLKQPEKKKLL